MNLNKRPTIVVGLDGATFKLLDPWLDQGDLPNLGHVRSQGAWGPLESVVPFITCPAWKCYSTGKNPDKLGVFYWVEFDWREGRTIPHDSRSFKSCDLWDYLNDDGIETAVISMPTTYPPRPLKGFMVTGQGTPEGAGYTYPEDLQKQLESRYGWRVHPLTLDVSRKRASTKSIIETINMRFALLWESLHEGRYGFLHTTTWYINWLHHFLWDDDVVLEAWRVVDDWIGKIIGSDVNLIIVSDHGEDLIHTDFSVNLWLSQQGLLRLRGAGGTLVRSWLNRENIAGLVRVLRLGFLYDVLRKPLRPLVQSVPSRRLDPESHSFSRMVDWEQSKAIATYQGPIYINRSLVGSGYEDLREEIATKLEQTIDPRRREKVLERIYRKEELYHGDYMDKAPDLVAVPRAGYNLIPTIGSGKLLDYERGSGWLARNAPYGILMAFGPDIASGRRLEGARLVDVAPTILHLMGVPIPKDMDGNVMEDIFAPGCEALQRLPEYQEPVRPHSFAYDLTAEEAEAVAERLCSLGYLE